MTEESCEFSDILLGFALTWTQRKSEEPAQMTLKRMIQAYRLLNVISDDLRVMIIEEAIREGFTGFVDFSDDLDDMLEDYS